MFTIRLRPRQTWLRPGYKLPMTAAKLAKSNPDAIICIGALIRGETPHFDYLSAAVAQGIQDVAIDSGIPTVFAVLTCDSMEQATARAGGDKGNKGAEAMTGAIEAACAIRLVRRGPKGNC